MDLESEVACAVANLVGRATSLSLNPTSRGHSLLPDLGGKASSLALHSDSGKSSHWTCMRLRLLLNSFYYRRGESARAVWTRTIYLYFTNNLAKTVSFSVTFVPKSYWSVLELLLYKEGELSEKTAPAYGTVVLRLYVQNILFLLN